MANLDTAAKRRAARQFSPWMTMPVADWVVGAPDRMQAAGVYSGIASTAPVIITYPRIIFVDGKIAFHLKGIFYMS